MAVSVLSSAAAISATVLQSRPLTPFVNDKVGAGGVACHRRAARVHRLQQAHAEDLVFVEVHKGIAGMIINVYLLIGQLGDQAAAGGEAGSSSCLVSSPLSAP